MKSKNVEDLYQLSPMQQGMLVHSLGQPGEYLIQLSHELAGPIDRDALARACRELPACFPVLRTSFHWEGLKRPVQAVHRCAEVALGWRDWSALCAVEREERLRALLAEDRRQGFDLSAPPLLRATLVRLAAEAHHLVWSWHHL